MISRQTGQVSRAGDDPRRRRGPSGRRASGIGGRDVSRRRFALASIRLRFACLARGFRGAITGDAPALGASRRTARATPRLGDHREIAERGHAGAAARDAPRRDARRARRPSASVIGAAMSLSSGPPFGQLQRRAPAARPLIAASTVRSGAVAVPDPEHRHRAQLARPASISTAAARAPMRARDQLQRRLRGRLRVAPVQAARDVVQEGQRQIQAVVARAQRQRRAAQIADRRRVGGDAPFELADPPSRARARAVSLPDAIQPTSTVPASAPSSIGWASVSSTRPGPAAPLATASAAPRHRNHDRQPARAIARREHRTTSQTGCGSITASPR